MCEAFFFMFEFQLIYYPSYMFVFSDVGERVQETRHPEAYLNAPSTK